MSSGRDAIAGSCRHLLCEGGAKSTSTTRSNQVGADTLRVHGTKVEPTAGPFALPDVVLYEYLYGATVTVHARRVLHRYS